MMLPLCNVRFPTLPVPVRMPPPLIWIGADAASDPFTVSVEKLFTVTPPVFVLAPVSVSFDTFVLSPTTS